MFSCISLISKSVPQSPGGQYKAKHKRILVSRHYCVISTTDNHKCLLLCLMKGGKTLDLEFQANFAIFVFWPHSLWPVFHFTLMLKDFLVQLQPSARHAVWSGPDLQQPYLQPETSSATTKETSTTFDSLLYSKQKGEKPAGPDTWSQTWSQTPQELPDFPPSAPRGSILPTYLQLKRAPFHCLCLHSLWPCLLNTNPCLKKVLSASHTQLQTVFPSTTRYHLIRAAGSELSLSGLGRYREKLWEEVSAHGPGSALQWDKIPPRCEKIKLAKDKHSR